MSTFLNTVSQSEAKRFQQSLISMLLVSCLTSYLYTTISQSNEKSDHFLWIHIQENIVMIIQP